MSLSEIEENLIAQERKQAIWWIKFNKEHAELRAKVVEEIGEEAVRELESCDSPFLTEQQKERL
jgi:hypothetical protein